MPYQMFGRGQFGIPVAGDQVIPVNGDEGANQFPMMPNSRVPLFDANEDICYIKSTDAGGHAVVKKYIMTPEPEEVAPQYVTMEEFLKLKEELLNGKQSVSE